MYPHLRKVTGTGVGQENLEAHTKTAVLDDSITACNAVCMMQCSFPALNDSVLHINCFRLCTFCGGTNSDPLGPEAREEENGEQVSPPHSTLGSERAS